jgi:hypothetical protein
MSAVTVLIARLTTAEGEKILPYDDATGLAVKAPKGNLSWGRGFNLMQCGSPGLFDVMETYLLTQLDTRLKAYPWYAALDEVRASVCLEISYNAGLEGLLHFPLMIAALIRQDWAEAAAQCHVQNPELAGRYAALAQLLLTGVS